MVEKRYLLGFLIIALILLYACNTTPKVTEKKEATATVGIENSNKENEIKADEKNNENVDDSEINKEENSEKPEEKSTDESENEEVKPKDYKLSKEELERIKPNELGEIMIIMYHGLSDKNAAYSRTVESFKGDLNELYDSGFRLISLKDLVNGDIDIEAGYTPVVLTFDDGKRSNFNIIIDSEGNKVTDSNSVVGILEEFYAEHKDFGLEATFYLNGRNAFGQEEYADYKLNYIISKGMDIGNHSYKHGHFKSMDSSLIEKTLADIVGEYEPRMNGYKIETLALPYGEIPKDDNAKEKLISGEHNGIFYNNIAILKVGWRPSVSVFDKEFNPYRLMRVQSGEGDFQLRHWLDLYKEKPELKFISDGNSKVITVKKKDIEKLSDGFKEKSEIIIY